MNGFLSRYEKQLPELFLSMYHEFKDEYLAEYEFLNKTDDLLESISKKSDIEDEFFLFLRNPVGSLFGFWLLDQNDFSQNPIVQFGRDGQFAVLAINFHNFLSQLHLLGADAWQLNNYLRHIEMQLLFEENESIVSQQEIRDSHPNIILTEKEIIEHCKTVRSYFGGEKTLSWLKSNEISEVKPNKLFDKMYETYHRSPNLKNYLDTKKSL